MDHNNMNDNSFFEDFVIQLSGMRLDIELSVARLIGGAVAVALVKTMHKRYNEYKNTQKKKESL